MIKTTIVRYLDKELGCVVDRMVYAKNSIELAIKVGELIPQTIEDLLLVLKEENNVL